MSTLYNAYISGLQRENIHQGEVVKEDFSRQFPDLATQLEDLLHDSRERCFFSNVSARRAEELQLTLSMMGLVCKYRPSENTLEQTFILEPLEEELIDCPFCGHRQTKPATLSGHRCASCGTKMTFFAKREKVLRNHSQFAGNKPTLSFAKTKTANSNTTNINVKHPSIKQAEIITRERRRTRSLYGGIVMFTLLGIIVIAAFVLFQSSNLRFKKQAQINNQPTVDLTIPDPQTKKQLNSNIAEQAQPIRQFAKANQAASIILRNPSNSHLNNEIAHEALINESAAIHPLITGQIDNITENYTLTFPETSDDTSAPLPSSISAIKAQQAVQHITTKKAAELALKLINPQKNLAAETALNATDIATVLAETPAQEIAEILMKENLLLNTRPDNTETDALIALPPSSVEQIKAVLHLTDQVLQSNTGYSILDNLPTIEGSANTIDLFQLIYALDQIQKTRPALLTIAPKQGGHMVMDSKNLPPSLLHLINNVIYQNIPADRQNVVADSLAEQATKWSTVLNLGLQENQIMTGLIPMALKLGLMTAQ